MAHTTITAAELPRWLAQDDGRAAVGGAAMLSRQQP